MPLEWPFFGDGIDSLGVDGGPIDRPMPSCGPDQLIVRVDAIGICASDAKMVTMGNRYPLFFPRDFASDPARLGHEAALTVAAVGSELSDRFSVGDRLGIQPDVYFDGRREIFGVNIPGAMAEYVLIDRRILSGDDGSYVFPAAPELSLAEIALLEPWSCVDAAFMEKRRLVPVTDGTLFVFGDGADTRDYTWLAECPSRRAILVDCSPSLVDAIKDHVAEVILRSGASIDEIAEEFGGDGRLDDIVLLSPSRSTIENAFERLAAFGTINVARKSPLGMNVSADMSRLHYETPSIVGTDGLDISQSYGPGRNRSELRAGGVTLIYGAGGTMGRMHVQRALEMDDHPRMIIAANRSRPRLDAIERDFGALARRRGIALHTVTTGDKPNALADVVDSRSGGRGFDDAVVCIPRADAVEAVLPYLAADGMLVIFAGVPLGTRVSIPIDPVVFSGTQITGTSGSSIADEIQVMRETAEGHRSLARTVAAVGGFRALKAGVAAVIDREYAGKVVIYPGLTDLPLMAISEVAARYPAVAAAMGDELVWTREAERAFLDAAKTDGGSTDG